MSRGGVTKRILLGKLIDTEKETIDVSGMIPDDILEEYLNLVKENQELKEEKEILETTLNSGMESVRTALEEKGIVTTIDGTFSSILTDIEELSAVRYNKGYNSGISYADGRNNTESMSYKTGYNAAKATLEDQMKQGKQLICNIINNNNASGLSLSGNDTFNTIAQGVATVAIDNANVGYANGVREADANGRSQLAQTIAYYGIVTAIDSDFNTLAQRIHTLASNKYNEGFTEHQRNIMQPMGTNHGYGIVVGWRATSAAGNRPYGSGFTSTVVTIGNHNGMDFCMFSFGGNLNMNGWTAMWVWYF